MDELRIETALISVYYKDGLEPIVRKLHDLGVKILSTGGTESYISAMKIPVISVDNLTGFPEILGGRVKTLHPLIFGGILGRRNLEQDVNQMKEHDIPTIDLVIVDLYPFEETLLTSKNESEIIEKIDIGGISLIRAAAKNFRDVLVCPSRNHYEDLLRILNERNGFTSLEDRQHFAGGAFNISSHYDTIIFNYFNRDNKIIAFKKSILQNKKLRYGENPHQQGIFYGDLNNTLEQLHGKEISYNNLTDMDAAIELMTEFDNTACAIIKHTNACGVAEGKEVTEVWEKALAGDPVSAFGGIIIFNRSLNKNAAAKINELFFEVIIARGYEEEALTILRQKKNRIIVVQKESKQPQSESQQKIFRSILNGVIEQTKDSAVASKENLKTVTNLAPSADQVSDLLFAEKCVKHLKSNAIALARNKQLIGMGCGQTSRVDALKQAIAKAKSFGFDLKDAVLASDAFFPFNDCVEIAHTEGIAAIIQPGGSVRDQDSIDLCNKYKMAMVFTGLRHFRH